MLEMWTRPPSGEVKRAWLNTAITVVVLGAIWGLAELGYWQFGTVLVLGLFVYLLWSVFSYFQRAKARAEQEESRQK
jgi:phosphatidylglycerophosphate synthase